MKPITDFIKRPEALAFLVAAVLHLLSQLPAVQGGAFVLPTESINLVVTVAYGVFFGFFIEGRFKKDDYVASLSTLWKSAKFQTLWLSIIALFINDGLLKPTGFSLPETVIADLGQLITVVASGKGLVDGLRLNQGTEIKLEAESQVEPKFLGRK